MPAILENSAAVRSPVPCQSTGAWYLKPTPTVILFIETVLDRILNSPIRQWEQAAWQEVVLNYVIGVEDRPPMKYRLLPTEEFSNVMIWDTRRAKNLSVENQILVHAGYIYDIPSKVREFKNRGWLHDNFTSASPEYEPIVYYSFGKSRAVHFESTVFSFTLFSNEAILFCTTGTVLIFIVVAAVFR